MIRTLFAPFFLLSTLFGSLSAETEPTAPATVTVRLYELAEAPDEEIARAASEASEIFERIGVRLEWLACGGSAPEARCNEVHGPAVVNLRLMPPHMQPPGGLPKGIFGFALMATGGGFSTTANVYFERVSEISDGRTYRRDVVLGAMMAHELGHLLLGVNSHSKKGLMTLPWGPKVLKAADLGMLSFSRGEAASILEAALTRLAHTGS